MQNQHRERETHKEKHVPGISTPFHLLLLLLFRSYNRKRETLRGRLRKEGSVFHAIAAGNL